MLCPWTPLGVLTQPRSHMRGHNTFQSVPPPLVVVHESALMTVHVALIHSQANNTLTARVSALTVVSCSLQSSPTGKIYITQPATLILSCPVAPSQSVIGRRD